MSQVKSSQEHPSLLHAQQETPSLLHVPLPFLFVKTLKHPLKRFTRKGSNNAQIMTKITDSTLPAPLLCHASLAPVPNSSLCATHPALAELLWTTAQRDDVVAAAVGHKHGDVGRKKKLEERLHQESAMAPNKHPEKQSPGAGSGAVSAGMSQGTLLRGGLGRSG